MTMERLGRYEIIDELGRGAMGIVYKGRDPLIDRVLAIKTVGLDLSREEAEAFEQRFYREAKSAGRLNHANIVTVHDVGKSDSIAYIAMEFLQGRSLRAIIDSGVVLPQESAAEIAAQVADGLAFAHDHGVVHRDIKPANIMVLDSGLVKITDFGIALLPTGSRTLAGTVFGSPKYMSPEQVVGRQVDGRADIFSLGAVLYEMLTGFPPFFGGDLDALLYQVINDMPAAPSTRNKTIAPAFDAIVAKAMAKHPDDRYADARAMAAELRNFRKLPVSAPHTADARTLERRAIRRRKGELPPKAAAPLAQPDVAPPTVQPTAADPVPVPQPALVSAAAITPVVETAPDPRRKLLLYGSAAAIVAILAMIGIGALISKRGTKPAAPVEAAAAVEKLALATPSANDAPAPPTASPGKAGTVKAIPEAHAQAQPAEAVASSAPSTTAKAVARLGLAVTPWGEVYVDGKKRGVSPPLTELKLAPGKHRIELRNTNFPPYSETVDAEPDATLKIRHKFQ
jgi:serine/threonine-protein kinase